MVRTRRTVFMAALTVAAAGVALAAGGSLDPSFGTGGVATVDTGAGPSTFEMAVQSDGKIVQVGQVADGVGGDRWQIRRFSATGAPDSSFGTAGRIDLFGGWNGPEGAQCVALDSSGRIVVGGYSFSQTPGTKKKPPGPVLRYATLVRLTTGGALDASFGTGGIVRTAAVAGSQETLFNDLAIQPDGKIVAGGRSNPTLSIGPKSPFVARYLATGVLDASFGSGGIQIEAAGVVGDEVRSLVLLAGGQVLVTTNSPGGSGASRMLRYLANGTRDTSFPANLTTDRALLLSVDGLGRIVRTGWTPYYGSALDLRVWRYLADGSADTSFGSGGSVTINAWYSERAVTRAVFPAGGGMLIGVQIQATNATPYRSIAAPMRLTDAGALDTAYGSGGFGATLDLAGPSTSNTYTSVSDLVPAGDGSFLLGGWLHNNSDSSVHSWYVAKYANE